MIAGLQGSRTENVFAGRPRRKAWIPAADGAIISAIA